MNCVHAVLLSFTINDKANEEDLKILTLGNLYRQPMEFVRGEVYRIGMNHL